MEQEEEEKQEGEPTLRDLMREMRVGRRKLSKEIKTNMDKFQMEMTSLKSKVDNLEKEMLTKDNVVNVVVPLLAPLEARLCALENTPPGTASPELKMLRKQVSKLDPANKSLRFRGFVVETVQERVEAIEKILRDFDGKTYSFEHLYKGPYESRVMTDMCVVEFASNQIREQILKHLSGKPFQDQKNGKLTIDRAKTAGQLVRNSYLRKVSDVLKKEPTCKDKPIEIVWQQDDRKDKSRTVTVNGQIAFRQNLDDVQGTFLAPFSNLTV